MKKRVMILMDVDTDAINRPSTSQSFEMAGEPFVSMARDLGVEGYFVSVYPSRFGGNVVDSAAHELGHVLSDVFALPGGTKDDPRGGAGLDRSKVTVEDATRMWSCEQQAWALAEKMRPDLDQIQKGQSLATYWAGVEHALANAKAA